MRRWLIAAVLVMGGPACAEGTGKKPGWLTDYARAKAQARRAGKLLFVVLRCEP